MLKPRTSEERRTRTVVDTIRFTPDDVKKWKTPPFQRPIKINDKVRALAEIIAHDGGVVPGILTFGKIGIDIYKVDGQHRLQAFLMSGKAEGFADARTLYFDDMAEMGEEFVLLNSQIVRMRPDDILRGLEESLPLLAKLRKECPFVGYDMVRRGGNAPILSVSVLLRAWEISSPDVPNTTADSAPKLAREMCEDSLSQLIRFTNLCFSGWGRDPEYLRLWSVLNLTLCMWLYRRMVLVPHSSKTKRIDDATFGKCLLSLSADGDYLDWLVGRQAGQRDRAPAYSRITAAMGKRLLLERGEKYLFPKPAWAHGRAGTR